MFPSIIMEIIFAVFIYSFSVAATPSEDGDGQLTSALINAPSGPELTGGTLNDNRLPDENMPLVITLSKEMQNFDVDPDEGDVTDKYLTLQYRKDVRSSST